MTRRRTPAGRRRLHLLPDGAAATACGRTPGDETVAGYSVTDPAAATCRGCVTAAADRLRTALREAAITPCGCGECPSPVQLLSLLSMDDDELVEALT